MFDKFFDGMIPQEYIDFMMANYEKHVGEPYDPEEMESILEWMNHAVFDIMIIKLVLDDGDVLVEWDHEENMPVFIATENAGNILKGLVEGDDTLNLIDESGLLKKDEDPFGQ